MIYEYSRVSGLIHDTPISCIRVKSPMFWPLGGLPPVSVRVILVANERALLRLYVHSKVSRRKRVSEDSPRPSKSANHINRVRTGERIT